MSFGSLQLNPLTIDPCGNSLGLHVDRGEMAVARRPSEIEHLFRETEQILDYYLSEDAGRDEDVFPASLAYDSYIKQSSRPQKAPTISMSSMSAVHYTTESSENIKGGLSSIGQTQRRDSNGSSSKGSVVTMPYSTMHTQENAMRRNDNDARPSTDRNLFTRRGMDPGHLAGLALVASPTARNADYGITPASAPASELIIFTAASSPSSHGHQRSRSDAQTSRSGSKALPRDVGIVGTIGTILSIPPEDAEVPQRIEGAYNLDSSSFSPENSLKAPIFQIPKSRSPSPGSLHSTSTSDMSNIQPERSRESLKFYENMPEAAEQDLRRLVTRTDPSPTKATAGRSPRLPFKPNQAQPISYLYYQPGVHTLAGPVPKPPRSVVNKSNTMPPPRPPRVLSPASNRSTGVASSKEVVGLSKTLQNLPKIQPLSVKPRSKSKSEKAAPSRVSNEDTSGPSAERIENEQILDPSHDSVHIREGAFPPSSIFLDAGDVDRHNHQPPAFDVALTEEPESDVVKDQSSTSTQKLGVELASRDSKHDSGMSSSVHQPVDDTDNPSPPSSYPSSEGETSHIATSNPLSADAVEQRRRASLPPLPHVTEELNTQPNHHFSTFWSGSVPTISEEPPVATSFRPGFRIKPPSKWPDSMEFRDIISMRTAAERCQGYAKKLRELSTEETGLRTWLILTARNTRERRDHSPSKYLSPQPPSHESRKKQRHVSYGSVNSEMTFPVRQDAYTATDLTPKAMEDASLFSMTPSVPYPALAEGVGLRKRDSRILPPSDAQLSSPASSTRALGGGFFATIGRKASLRKERPLPLTTGSVRVIPATQSNKLQQPRAVRIDATPTLPGGPRARAKPTQRVHNLLATKPQSYDSSPASTHISSRTFEEQLEKLADFLPQADKDTLAECLRKTPDHDPMLAINAYLEDEKQRLTNIRTR